jgi:hypothetical protein
MTTANCHQRAEISQTAETDTIASFIAIVSGIVVGFFSSISIMNLIDLWQILNSYSGLK